MNGPPRPRIRAARGRRSPAAHRPTPSDRGAADRRGAAPATRAPPRGVRRPDGARRSAACAGADVVDGLAQRPPRSWLPAHVDQRYAEGVAEEAQVVGLQVAAPTIASMAGRLARLMLVLERRVELVGDDQPTDRRAAAARRTAGRPAIRCAAAGSSATPRRLGARRAAVGLDPVAHPRAASTSAASDPSGSVRRCARRDELDDRGVDVRPGRCRAPARRGCGHRRPSSRRRT